jgi:DNA-binding GntR family transcriptional regulator
MESSPNDRQPKTLALYERMRDDVTAERMAPGSRLSELDLVRRYEVSRTPVREALARLEQDGLLERRGSALYVKERSPDEIIDIYRVRIYVEGAIAHDAAHRRTEMDLIRIEAAAARCAAAPVDDPKALQAANTAFHQALANACHNQTLRELQDRLTIQVAKLPSTTLSFPGRWEEAIEEHVALVRAIRAQDAAAAERIGRAHMTRACEIRLKLTAQEVEATMGAPAQRRSLRQHLALPCRAVMAKLCIQF